jgi:nucleoside-diphosphate-sugar epimerase
MRVLVTGNLGYIGPALVARLRADGHETVGLDTGWFLHANVAPPELPDVQHFVDVRDLMDGSPESRRRLASVLEDVDAVCHLAGLSNDPLSNLDRELTQDINYEASARLSSEAKRAGIERFVFYSSCSVYGAAEHEVNETSPTGPLTAYAETKLALEDHLRGLVDDHFRVGLFRNATVYGYAPALRLDLLVNGMTAWALTTGVVRLMSTGQALRPQLHIADLVDLTASVLGHDERLAAISGQPLNVGSTDANYSIREIGELVAGRIPGAAVRRDEDAWVDARSYRVNFDRIVDAIPGFRVHRTIEESVPAIAQAYRDVELTEDDVRALRFTRLRQLQRSQDLGLLDGALRPRPLEPTSAR